MNFVLSQLHFLLRILDIVFRQTFEFASIEIDIFINLVTKHGLHA